MYTRINTYNVLARVIWPATFARSAGPPGGGRTYKYLSGAYEGRSVQLRGTAFESERLRHFPFMDIFSSGA